jgi:hypothetical protein
LNLDLKGFPSDCSEELRQAAELQHFVLPSLALVAVGRCLDSSFAYLARELATPYGVGPQWAFAGITCIMLSGSRDGPIFVQHWLEALKAEHVGLTFATGYRDQVAKVATVTRTVFYSCVDLFAWALRSS